MLRLSRTSKLDGILSWSLQALDTCPGSIGSNGSLVPACQGCYATTGNYHYPNVKEPRLANREDWKRTEWVNDMVNALESQRYFRWFDSGDMYSVALAEKILQVMTLTPWVRHWLPTRMHKFDKFQSVLSQMKALDNVSVRFSADSVDGSYVSGLHGSVIGADASSYRDNGESSLCKAYQHGGQCNGCRACWDKSIPLIAYPAHGAKMAKVIKIMSYKKGN